MFEKNMKIVPCDGIFEWKIWKKEEGKEEVVEMLENVQLEYVKVRRVWIGRGDEEILIVVKKGREEDFFRFLD